MNGYDEDRLRAALREAAERVHPAGDGLARIQHRVARRRARLRWLRPALALGAAAVLAAGTLSGLQLAGGSSDTLRQGNGFTGPGESPSPAPSPSPTPSTPSTSPSPGVVPASLPEGLLPLWPFPSAPDLPSGVGTPAATAEQTALSFTRDYLGFTEVDRVISTQRNGGDATVAVGYATEGTRTATAAVLHLVQWSGTPYWEVVGSFDTTLSITAPAYGAAVTSPLSVGGKITGVDESIRVSVRQPTGGPAALGDACCTPAGGQGSTWSEQVGYTGASDPVLTVVASTGGHIQGVERFAVTGIRPAAQAEPSGSAAPKAYPATYVGSKAGRIGVFSSADGNLQRWLTAGPNDVDPKTAGNWVYYLGGAGSTNAVGDRAGTLMRVPASGGRPQPVTAGADVTGFGVSAKGQRLAYTTFDANTGAWTFVMLDTGAGSRSSFGMPSAPPVPVGDPAWSPDGARVAVAVRTGNAATVYAYDPKAARAWTDGQPMCGEQPAGGLPQAVAYAPDGRLLVAAQQGAGVSVDTCTPDSAAQLFQVAAASRAADVSAAGDAVLLAAADGGAWRWTPGGQPERVGSGFDGGASW